MGRLNAIFAGFDEVNVGPFLSLTNNDLLLQTSQTVDEKRMARSVYSITTVSNFEAILYSPAYLNGTLSNAPAQNNKFMVGICTVQAALNNYVGSDVYGFAYNYNDGYIWNNGAQYAFMGLIALGDVASFVVDPINAVMYMYQNGALLGSCTITANQAWYFAGTVASAPTYFALYINNGITPFLYNLQTSQALTGWWAARTAVAAINLSTEPYMSFATDINPFEKYAGDIDAFNTPMVVSESVHFWPWGNSAPAELGSGGLVQMQINDPKGLYTDLTADAVRDVTTQLSRVQSSTAMSSAERLFTGIFDHCEIDTRQTKQVYIRDQTARLAVPILRALYPPTAASTVAFKPRPLSLGICRNYQLELYDAINLFFAMSDEPVSAIGRTRVGGKQVALGAGGYQLTTDLEGIDFTTAPNGVVTTETTDFGGVFSSGLTDYLGGVGVFGSVGTAGGGTTGSSSTAGQTATTGAHTIIVTSPAAHPFSAGSAVSVSGSGGSKSFTGTVTSYNSGTGSLVINATSVVGTGTMIVPLTITGGVNQPTGWQAQGQYQGLFPATSVMTVTGSAPNKFVRFPQVADGVYWMQPLTAITLHQNHSYAYNFTTVGIPYFGATQDANGGKYISLPGKLVFGYVYGNSISWTYFDSVSLDHVGAYSGVFVNNTGADRTLVIGFLCNEVIQGTGGVTSYLDISSFAMNELAALTDNVSLQGPGLTNILKNVLVQHGPLDISELETNDTDAIDTATGYTYGYHCGSNDQPLVSDVTQAILNSCCSSLYTDPDGTFRVGRLYAPDLVVGGGITGYLTATDTQGEIITYPDLADNLTTKAQACRNYYQYSAADFQNDTTTDVPLAVRAQLMAAFQVNVTAGVQLAYRYAERYNKDPATFLMDLQAHAQSEITYVNNLYTIPRDFYVGQFFEPIWRTFKLMQTWNVKFPIPGLSVGKNVIVVGRQRNPASEFCTLILWG